MKACFFNLLPLENRTFPVSTEALVDSHQRERLMTCRKRSVFPSIDLCQVCTSFLPMIHRKFAFVTI